MLLSERIMAEPGALLERVATGQAAPPRVFSSRRRHGLHLRLSPTPCWLWRFPTSADQPLFPLTTAQHRHIFPASS